MYYNVQPFYSGETVPLILNHCKVFGPRSVWSSDSALMSSVVNRELYYILYMISRFCHYGSGKFCSHGILWSLYLSCSFRSLPSFLLFSGPSGLTKQKKLEKRKHTNQSPPIAFWSRNRLFYLAFLSENRNTSKKDDSKKMKLDRRGPRPMHNVCHILGLPPFLSVRNL